MGISKAYSIMEGEEILLYSAFVFSSEAPPNARNVHMQSVYGNLDRWNLKMFHSEKWNLVAEHSAIFF